MYVCTADHYYMKIVYKFQSEIRIPNVYKSNSNFKIEVRKFELRFTSLLTIHHHSATINLHTTSTSADINRSMYRGLKDIHR